MNKPNFEPNFDNDRDFDDLKLMTFLKQNQPISPPASTNLQAKVMAELASTAIARPLNIKRLEVKKIPKKIGSIGAAIVTTLSLLTFNQLFNHRPIQTAVNDAETIKLEKSLISNWHLSDEEFTSSYSVFSNSNYE